MLFFSSADKVLILLDILPGRFLIIFGGWLKRMLICNGLLSELLSCWYLPIVRFMVTSTKFVLQVIPRSKSSLNVLNLFLFCQLEVRWYIQNKLIRHHDTNLSYIFSVLLIQNVKNT